MGLFSHGKSNNKGFWSTMAVNAFNQGNDQQALQFATLGYEGSVQNIQMAINNRNFKKQQEQMKQQQEELQQKTDEASALTEQSTNQNQKQNVQGVRRNAKETNSQKDSNLTQGTNSTGTWLKKALGGDNTNNSEEWY
jgi:hypothetical protein